MVYLFLESDEYMVAQRVAGFKAALGNPELVDLNLSELEGSKTDPGDILGHAGMVPFLCPRRLIIVRDYLAYLEKRMNQSKDTGSAVYAEAAQLFTGLGGVPETTDLVLIDGKIDKRKALWRGFSLPDNRSIPGLQDLVKTGEVHHEEYKTPEAKDLPNWVINLAKERDIAIETRAAHLLATLVGGNLRQLDNELEKLATYARGRAIKADDVNLLVSDASEAIIWSLTDALSQRDARGAMQALQALRRNEANQYYLLTMIARQYRLLLLAKEALRTGRGKNEFEISKLLGEKQYPVKKALQQHRGYSADDLVEILDRLVQADFAMKIGADPDTTIDIIIAELTQRARRAA
jgi:DNA polymerase-3 subunit delta